MFDARARRFLNGHCPNLPVPDRSMPESARARCFCPFPITNIQGKVIIMHERKWIEERLKLLLTFRESGTAIMYPRSSSSYEPTLESVQMTLKMMHHAT